MTIVLYSQFPFVGPYRTLNVFIPAYGPQERKILVGLILLEFNIIGTVVIAGAVQGALPPEEDDEFDEFEDEFDDEPGDEVGLALHAAVLIVSVVVETVPPKAKALPVHVTVLPMVMPDASMSVPAKVVFAPSVVAAVGVQNTSQADAPFESVTTEFAVVVSAPFTLKINVPLPERVIPAAPIDAALEAPVQ